MADYILPDRQNHEQFELGLEAVAEAIGVEVDTIEWVINCDGAFTNDDWLAIRRTHSEAQIDHPGNGLVTWNDPSLVHLDADALGKRYHLALDLAQTQDEQLCYELEELRDIAAALYRISGLEEWLWTAARWHNAFMATLVVSRFHGTTGHEEQLVMKL